MRRLTMTSGPVVSLYAARDGGLWLKSMGRATRHYPKAADPNTFTTKSDVDLRSSGEPDRPR